MKDKTEKLKGGVETTKWSIDFLSKDLSVNTSLSYAQFDPSGRFLGCFADKENKLMVFNLFGDQLFELNVDKATQVNIFCI